MIGAGVFAAVGPAAGAAGWGMLGGLALAGVVAYANATSSAQLAAVYPEAGGTYAYARQVLNPFWGFLAGWGFIAGKTASLAAMAFTVGAYSFPGASRLVAIGTVVTMTAINYSGIRKTAFATRVIVAVVLATLAVAVTTSFSAASFKPDFAPTSGGFPGILQAAALLFFAFAGYARIATLGEEVVEPKRVIPRAIPLALAITLAVYLLVAVAALTAIGPETLAESDAPLATAAMASGWPGAGTVVRAGAVVAACGVLLSLLAGVSRTMFAMARQRELPSLLATVHPRFQTPHLAELLIGLLVILVVSVGDLRGAVGFSSFTVLGYYAIANVCAWRQPPQERRFPRWLAPVGVLGCLLLAFALPAGTVIAGLTVFVAGALVWFLRSKFVSG